MIRTILNKLRILTNLDNINTNDVFSIFRKKNIVGSELYNQIREFLWNNEKLLVNVHNNKNTPLNIIKIPLYGVGVNQAHVWLDHSLQIWTSKNVKLDIDLNIYRIYEVFPLALEKMNDSLTLVLTYRTLELKHVG
jgi:hypothetical protein